MKVLVSGQTSVYMVGGGGVGLSHPCDSHVYVIENNGEAALIDAGSGIAPEKIRDHIIADNIAMSSIKFIMLTHSHWDHARGASWWVKETGARLAVHRLGVPILEQTLWPASHIERHGAVSRPVKVDQPLEDGDNIQIGSISVFVIHTPGHTDDSISFYCKSEGHSILFSGDTCFAEGGHGTVNADTDFRAYRASIHRLDEMKINVLFPGHKHFVLAYAFAHITLLKKKISENWTDVIASRVPFFPTWWLENDPSLYNDACANP